jgi:transposase
MELSRKEKEGIVLDLYHNKGYTCRQIAEELRMSFNQISDILKSHEDSSEEKKEIRGICKGYP